MSEPTERELQEYGERLARFRAITAPSALRRDLRGALLAAPVAETAPAGTAWAVRGARRSWLVSLRPVLAALVLFAILAGGAGSAAAGSLPGDAAFGLKRAVEVVQVALAPDDNARLDLLVAQTDQRLSDLETLASRRSSNVTIATDEYLAALSRLQQTLATVAGEPATSARDAAITHARDTVAQHVARLQSLASELPGAAQQGIQRAIDAGQTIRTPKTPRPSKSDEPGRPSGAPGGVPSNPGGRPSDLPSSHPTPPPTPSHR